MEYYASICRLCESPDQTGDSWVELFSPMNDQVLPMIRACANIVLCENDELPQSICGRCYQNVELSYNFKIQCEVTDTKLRHEIALRAKKSESSNISVLPFLVDRNDTNVDGTLAADEVFVKTEVEEDEDNGQVVLAGESYDEVCLADLELKIEVDWNTYKNEPSVSESEDGLDGDEKRTPKAKKTQTMGVQATQQSHICKICGKNFRNRKNFNSHNQAVHGPKPYKCSQCSKCYLKKSCLQSHEATQHAGIRHFECPQCDKKYASGPGLKSHMEDVHSDSFACVCDKCGKKYATASKLRSHYIVHIETRDAICDICNKGFKTKVHLNDHMITCHLQQGENRRNGVQQESCGEISNGINAYNTDVGVHTDEKKYECHICFKRFNSESSIRRHKLVHTAEKSHVCHYCQKAFRQKHHVNQHIRGVHSNEKPYKCKFCPRAFTTIWPLRRHARRHGEPIGNSKQDQEMPLAAPHQQIGMLDMS